MRDLDKQAALFSQGPVVVFRWGVQEGWPVDFVSDNAEALFGHSAADFLNGKIKYENVVHPDDLDRVSSEVAWTVENGPDRFQHEDYRIIRRDGEIRWLQDFTVLERDDDGIVRFAMGYVVDVTKRREIETELRRARSDLEELVAVRDGELSHETARREHSEAFRLRDDETRRSISQAAIQFLESGDWTEVIDGVIATLGRAADVDRVYVFENSKGEGGEILTSQRFEWVGPGVTPYIGDLSLIDLPLAEAGFSRWIEAMSRGQAVSGMVKEFTGEEKRILQEQGIVSILAVPVFLNGDWWGFIGFDDCTTGRDWRDVDVQTLRVVAGALGTAIRRTRDQLALRESEERFRSIFENTTVGVAIADLDGNYQMVNRALADILGYSCDELTEMNISDVTHPSHRETGERLMSGYRSGTTDAATDEKRYIRKDGKIVWAMVSTSLVRDAAGRPSYTIRNVQDVTEHKRAEEAAVRLHGQLAHVSRVSTMGELAAGFAHELNQPLAAITNFATGTLRRQRSGAVTADDMIRVFELVVEQARRAGDIIRRIRQFIQKETPETTSIDVNVAIVEAIGLVKGEALAKDMAIETDLDEGLPSVLGDAIQLQQLVVNLVRNGIEAMQEAPASDRKLTVRTKVLESGDVGVSVSDTGVGLSEKLKKRIFDPFFSTKASGMGMGLSICRSIAEAHGGRLSVESAEGAGTTFLVVLGADEVPARTDKAGTETKAEENEPES